MPAPQNVTTLDLVNQKRDLNDVLNTIFQRKSNFASLFPLSSRRAVNSLYEWNEDYIALKTVEATAVNTTTGIITISADDSARLYVGAVLRLPNSSATFRVTAKASTTATLEFVSQGGSDVTTIAGLTTGVYRVSHVPMPEGSREGERYFRQTGQNSNRTLIIRKEVDMSRSAQGMAVYGNEANMTLQMERAMIELSDEINSALIFGTKTQRTASVNGDMGGLYEFATQPNSLEIDVSGAESLSSELVNDAFELAWKTGTTPSIILCSTANARRLSAEMRDQVAMQRADETRGTRANVVVNDFAAEQMRIMADIEINDSDVFIIDPSGFNFVYYSNGDLTRMRAGKEVLYDGDTEAIVGEITSEWRNAWQRIVRIKNLKTT